MTPTDAGLGAATVLNPVVPVRVRRMLNVESGLNDGLCTPFVLFAIAALAGEEGLAAVESIGAALQSTSPSASSSAWSSAPAPACCSAGRASTAGAPGTPGPSRSWCCRSWPTSRPSCPRATRSWPPSSPARPSPVPPAGSRTRSRRSGSPRPWPTRSASPSGSPSASSPCRCSSRTPGGTSSSSPCSPSPCCGWRPWPWPCSAPACRHPTVAFVGWFGPRGLASVVFTLLAAEGLELDPDLTQVIAAICLTVLLSVLAHGLSADPLARRYGAWVERTRPEQELLGATEPRSRRSLTHRARPSA